MQGTIGLLGVSPLASVAQPDSGRFDLSGPAVAEVGVVSRPTRSLASYSSSVDTPFGAPWEELAIEHLVAFFATPREESQTWDAKGTTITADTFESPSVDSRIACSVATSSLV
jgi:hypothetical protein